MKDSFKSYWQKKQYFQKYSYFFVEQRHIGNYDAFFLKSF